MLFFELDYVDLVYCFSGLLDLSNLKGFSMIDLNDDSRLIRVGLVSIKAGYF